jgi:hypothetical protein
LLLTHTELDFSSTELKLLQDKGYLLAVADNSSDSVAACCNGPSQQRNKTYINHAQINAPCAVYAPWSDKEQVSHERIYTINKLYQNCLQGD